MLAESMAGMGEKYPEVSVQTELARGLPEEALRASATGWTWSSSARTSAAWATRLLRLGVGRGRRARDLPGRGRAAYPGPLTSESLAHTQNSLPSGSRSTT